MRREWIEGYLFMSPWLIGFFIWTLGPMIFSAAMSFMKWEVLTPPEWVGLENLRRLFGDELFYKSLYNTAFYTFLSVPLRMVLALFAAVLLNTQSRTMPLFRTFLYMPSVIPQVASVILWVWIFSPTYGLANMLLRVVGIPDQMWMLDAAQVKPVFVFMSLWYIGSQMVIFLAALQGVPESLKEAALMDGATPWRQFLHVVLPMISPVVFFNLVIGIINSFQVFTTSYLATGGGPNNASLFILLYLYQNAFEYLNMGYASVLAWVVFVIVISLTFVQFRLSGRWVYYEGGLTD
jgi:multiple sugar transport system permease protein